MKTIKFCILLCLCILSSLLLIGCVEQKTKTIYVATKVLCEYSADSTQNAIQHIELDDNGFPIRTATQYVSDDLPFLESTYIYNEHSLAEKIINFFYDYSATEDYLTCTLNNDKLKTRYDVLCDEINNSLSSQNTKTIYSNNHSYSIVDISPDGYFPYIYSCPQKFDLVHNRNQFLYYTIQHYNENAIEQTTCHNFNNILWDRTITRNLDGNITSTTNNHFATDKYSYSIDWLFEPDGTNHEIIHNTETLLIDGVIDGISEHVSHRNNIYNDNGCLIQRTSYEFSGEKISDIFYEYDTFEVPIESIDFLCRFYNYLEIPYHLPD